MIINRGAAKVDNHISRDYIFDYHSIRECNYYIYFIIPTIRPFIFYRFRPTMVREFQKENNAQPLVDMHEWNTSFTKMFF